MPNFASINALHDYYRDYLEAVKSIPIDYKTWNHGITWHNHHRTVMETRFAYDDVHDVLLLADLKVLRARAFRGSLARQGTPTGWTDGHSRKGDVT